MMKAATAAKPAGAEATAVKIVVDAADKSAVGRGGVAALNRARALLANAFDVTVTYEPSSDEGEAGGEEPESGGQAAA